MIRFEVTVDQVDVSVPESEFGLDAGATASAVLDELRESNPGGSILAALEDWDLLSDVKVHVRVSTETDSAEWSE